MSGNSRLAAVGAAGLLCTLLAGCSYNRPQGCLGFEPHCDGNVAVARCNVSCPRDAVLPINCRTSYSRKDCAAEGWICRGRAVCIDRALTPCKRHGGSCNPDDPYVQDRCLDTGKGMFISQVKLPKGKQCVGGPGATAYTVDTPLAPCDPAKWKTTCKDGVIRSCVKIWPSQKAYFQTSKCPNGCKYQWSCG